VTIRPATEDDLAEIASLIRDLADYENLAHEIEWTHERELTETLFGPAAVAKVLIAETDDGRVAGFALWFATYSTFLGRPGIWLEDLFVRPAHRGQGFGKDLLGTLMAMSDGRVEWAVLDWNEPSIAFYRSLGAEPVEGWTRYRWARGSATPPEGSSPPPS
jgi:GNAT superfamily N-acetyltransferase